MLAVDQAVNKNTGIVRALAVIPLDVSLISSIIAGLDWMLLCYLVHEYCGTYRGKINRGN